MVREQQMMRAGLRRLLTESELPMFGSGRNRGVFERKNPTAERVANVLLQEKLVETGSDGESWRLTSKGLDWLAEHDNLVVLLEDLVRAFESHGERIQRIEQLVRAELTRSVHQHAVLTRLLARLGSNVEWSLDHALFEWLQNSAKGPRSVSDVFEVMVAHIPELTIGQFHDVLRRFKGLGLIRLTPWTGPLYELTRPEIALLIGHEVLYYVEAIPADGNLVTPNAA
jgi:hypothetical protein